MKIIFITFMQKLFIAFLLFTFTAVFSQNESIANHYFDKNEFEKALISYQELLKAQPQNYNYFTKVVACHQALFQYDKAFELLKNKYDQSKNPLLLIEIGHHFKLQKNESEKNKYFEMALDAMKVNKNYATSMAVAFERKAYLEEAIKCYEFAQTDNPGIYDYQIGLLYGQSGNIDLMINKLLDVSFQNENLTANVQNQLAFFMRNDPDDAFVNQLRKNLLIKVQKSQDIFWNRYLSWLFIQQKQYDKAFVQEKAIFKRDPDNFYNFMFLAQMTFEQKAYQYTKEICDFILKNTNDPYQIADANYYLLSIKINEALPAQYENISKEIETILDLLGKNERSFSIIQLYANFQTFYRHQPEKGRQLLEEALNYRLNPKELGQLKLDLGDIYLYEEKFNLALLQYAQVESVLSHDPIGHEANLKMAKTNYFKGDRTWALEQFKVLKSVASQLIANDALEYYMLLSDNEISADSIHKPLDKFTKADLLYYQNKKNESLALFKQILNETSDDEIKDDVLFRLAKIYQETNQDDEALVAFETIISNHEESVFRDEAYYFGALIYLKKLNENKAKEYLEAILNKHQDSIYFIEARQKLRELIDKNKDI